jgi:uncharacterized damage-inducible protein DinB
MRLIIDSSPPFGPELGRLVTMLTYVRETTLRACAGLSMAQLDSLHDPASNSIGALLAHIAAVESSYQVMSFEARLLDAEEERAWEAALELGDRGRAELRGRPLQSYLDHLEEVRNRTLRGLRLRSDAWLDERVHLGAFEANHYWMWFHLMEDELNHRGQIRWLRSRLT